MHYVCKVALYVSLYFSLLLGTTAQSTMPETTTADATVPATTPVPTPSETRPDCAWGAAWNGTRCTCNAGFYRENEACVECPLHHICFNEILKAVAEFDPGLRTLSPRTVLLEDAVCAPGMFRTSRTDVCKPCPRDFFCPSERDTGLPNVVRCAENQFTYDTGAESSSDCVCLAGFKMILDDETVQCLPCTEGQRCQDGSVVEELCHLQNKVASASHDMCVCKAGFGLLNFECSQCAPGFVKPTAGDTQCSACADATYAVNSTSCLACPEHSDAKAGSASCTCAAPFVWNESACAICPENHFWLDLVCHACPAESLSVSSPSMLAGPAACSCARGYNAEPQNVSGILQCVPCAAGQYEDEGVCVACPSGAWTAAASSAVLKGSGMPSVCVCNNTCEAQLVDGSCAGECASTPAACEQCDVGYNKSSFSTAGNEERCSVCAEGTFQGATGALLCEECPMFEWHELLGQTSVASCLCIEGFERSANASCTACRPGYYKNWIGNDVCLPCAVGSYNPQAQATACFLCMDATLNDEQFAQALELELAYLTWAGTVLANNTLAAFANYTLANLTLANYTLANYTLANLTLANYTLANLTLANNIIASRWMSLVFSSNTTVTQASVSVLQCVCEVGQQPVNDGMRSRCESCEAGSFKESANHEQCTYCGAVSTRHGHSLLHHYGASVRGATDSTHCVPCPAFSGQDEDLVGPSLLRMGSVEDCMCFRGHEYTTDGCRNCSQFQIQPLFSNNMCSYCPAGHFFVARNVPCQLCDVAQDGGDRHVGLVLNSRDPNLPWADDESDCVCRAGFERTMHGVCTACVIGKFRNSNSTRHCELCPIDTFQDAAAQLACLTCPEHSSTLGHVGSTSVFKCVCAAGFQPVSEAGLCAPCPPGTFRSSRLANESAAECLECPQDHYCPAGSAHPVSCPTGEVSEAGSHSVLQCQCRAGFGRYASLNCTLCPRGSFSVSSSNAECTLCPSNKTTVYTGSKNETECVCIPGHGIIDFLPSSPCAPCSESSFAPGFKNEPCTSCGWGALSLTGIESDSCQCNARIGLFIT
jgi:hypothetical protein